MARKRYERDVTDYRLDFDPDTTSEVFVARRAGPHYVTRYNGGVGAKRIDGRKAAVKNAHAQNKIYKASRKLVKSDARFVAGAIKAAMSGFDKDGIVQLFDMNAASILTVRHARAIFRNFYLPETSHIEAVKNFNEAAKEANQEVNQRNPQIVANLGEISVFGAENTQESSAPVVVYLGISEDAAAKVYGDHQTLVDTLQGRRHRRGRPLPYFPHLSIAEVNTPETGLALQAHIQESLAANQEIAERQITFCRSELKLSSAA